MTTRRRMMKEALRDRRNGNYGSLRVSRLRKIYVVAWCPSEELCQRGQLRGGGSKRVREARPLGKTSGRRE